MANTYEAIATVEVGSGGAANIDFTSIPATYTDLLLKTSARSNYASGNWDNIILRINNSSSGIYDSILLYGDGSASGSLSNPSGTSVTYLYATNANNTASTFCNLEIYFPNYTSSNNKSFSIDNVTENNATDALAVITAGLWSNSAAINQITLTPNSTLNFVEYSTATLYGIKNS
jgi:hypothetical protein